MVKYEVEKDIYLSIFKYSNLNHFEFKEACVYC